MYFHITINENKIRPVSLMFAQSHTVFSGRATVGSGMGIILGKRR